MNVIFKKMNFKDQEVIHVINPPESFHPAILEMESLTQVKTTLGKAKGITFFLAFVTKQKEVDRLARDVTPLMKDGGVLWFAYPKGTSKKYTCEFNRDTGWTVLGNLGFEGVRMVAIDEDWSALRFKKAESIKKMTRSFAMSDGGRKKVAAQKEKNT